MNKKIIIKLNGPQRKVIRDESRFRAFAAGRRSGKTHCAALDMQKFAVNNPGSLIVYLSPTYSMARRNVLPVIKKYMPREYISAINYTRLEILLMNGSVIYLGGTHNYDAFRGLGISMAVFDEAADIPEEAWYEAIRPALSDTMGKALFVGTPEGKDNWFYQIFTEESYSAHSCTTLEGGFVSAGEIEAARRQIDERIFRQEYLASFEMPGRGVYYAYGDANLSSCNYHPARQTWLCWDFNVNPLSTILVQEIKEGLWCAVYEFVTPNTATRAQCEIIERFFSENGAPASLGITGDFAGGGRSTKASFSDYEIIRRAFKNYPGYVEKKRRTTRQKDRVNATNAMFLAADGSRKLFVNNKKCPRLHKDLKIVEWKEGGAEINKKQGVSDPSDALSYFAYNLFPVRPERIIRHLY